MWKAGFRGGEGKGAALRFPEFKLVVWYTGKVSQVNGGSLGGNNSGSESTDTSMPGGKA